MADVVILKSWKDGNWSQNPEVIKFWTESTEKPKKKKKVKNGPRS